jgi:hypothetical protein
MRLLMAGALLLTLQGASAQVLRSADRPRPQVKPYTMTQSITTSRTYGSGMTSTETRQQVFMRDSEGRTRNEMERAATPAMKIVLDSGGIRLMRGRGKSSFIYVNDAVERTSMSWSTDPEMAKEVRLTQVRQMPAAPRPALSPAKTEDGLVAEEWMEKLGTRAIQGVIAEGTRWSTRYPAGAFGMSQEFTVLREDWFSRDYAVSLESTNDDPRFGKTVTTLVSFSDAEPDPALFKPPAGYTLISDAKVEEVAEKQ